MKTFSYIFSDAQTLQQALQRDQLLALADSGALLIQIYSGIIDPEHCQTLAQLLRGHFTQAVIVGATTAGEIHQGEAQSLSTQISISVFEHTQLSLLRLSADDIEQPSLGTVLSAQQRDNTQAALLLTTPL